MIDNDNKNVGFGNTDIFNHIKDNLEFTELISEYPDKNDKKALITTMKNGKTVYTKWEN